MAVCSNRIGIGARGQVSAGEETCYGSAVNPTKRIDFLSESIANNVSTTQSETLNPNRSIRDLVRTSFSIEGDVAYEQSVPGHELFYRHALGDVITLYNVDGGIRAQIGTDATGGSSTLTLKAYNVAATWPASGQAVVVSRTSAGDLTSDLFTWTGKTDGTGLTGVTGLGLNIIKGDRIFLADTSNYLAVYTHYYEAGKTLPIGLTVEVGRDIAYFQYTGMKINQIAETFNAQAILTGTFSFIGRAEALGGLLNGKGANKTPVLAGDTTAILKPGSYVTADGTSIVGFKKTGDLGTFVLQVEGENDVTYTGYTLTSTHAVIYGIPSSGTGSMARNHNYATPIVPQSSWAQSVLSPPTADVLAAFQAALYIDNVFQEVLAASYTLNNNLFTDKFQIGDRFRAQAPEQRRQVTGSITIEFDDTVLYKKYTEGVASELEIRVVDDGPTGQIGTTNVYKQKSIIFPKIKYSGTTPQIGGPDVITTDMPFQALFDSDDNEPEMIMIIVNSVERAPYGS